MDYHSRLLLIRVYAVFHPVIYTTYTEIFLYGRVYVLKSIIHLANIPQLVVMPASLTDDCFDALVVGIFKRVAAEDDTCSEQ